MRQERDMGTDATALQNSAKAAVTASPAENEIATVAYQLWLERGCPHGSDQEDWFRAEAMLKNALVMKGEDLPSRPSVSCCDTRTEWEMLGEFASEIWQEGHWEVWEREWVSALWVSDLRHPGVVVSNPACSSGKAA
jgi:hypothetical protein